MIDKEILEATMSLLSEAGLPGFPEIRALDGGGNNRVFLVTAESKSFILKSYFSHPLDTRDRLNAEFAFTSFAWEMGLRQIPEPVACNRAKNIALYEYIDGEKLKPGDISIETVRAAGSFFLDLNTFRHTAEAGILPDGSEACFSAKEHVECVGRRLDRLERGMTCADEIGSAAVRFVSTDLRALWLEIVDFVSSVLVDSGVSYTEPLRQSDRCLSPSDFGFHNAIRDTSGRVRFIDFEYAGWDDPAKMACDFFCQPAVPVPWDFFDFFVEMAMTVSAGAEAACFRINALFPLYRLKWIMIVLNDFIESGDARRRYANDSITGNHRRAAQLDKALTMFERLKGSYNRGIL